MILLFLFDEYKPDEMGGASILIERLKAHLVAAMSILCFMRVSNTAE